MKTPADYSLSMTTGTSTMGKRKGTVRNYILITDSEGNSCGIHRTVDKAEEAIAKLVSIANRTPAEQAAFDEATSYDCSRPHQTDGVERWDEFNGPNYE